MTSRVATILDLIDTALADPGQHSPESHQYLDVAPTMPAAGTCWRCTTHPTAEGSELCAGCRSYLLEDSEEDPAHALVDWQTINRLQWGRGILRGPSNRDRFGIRPVAPATPAEGGQPIIITADPAPSGPSIASTAGPRPAWTHRAAR